jgi:hypothetical protein
VDKEVETKEGSDNWGGKTNSLRTQSVKKL